MKNNLLKFTAILLAIGLSAFTGKTKSMNLPFSTHCFRFTGNSSSMSSIRNFSNYVVVSSLSCPGPEEIICGLCTTDIYTHPVLDGEGEVKEVLNTTVDTPVGEDSLRLTIATGYLDIVPNPDVQYYILASGTGYTPYNQHH